MKQIILALIAAGGTLSAIAQTPDVNRHEDRDMSRWVLDLNFLGGIYTQHTNVANTAPNYLNGINVNTGQVGFKNGTALGGDAQIGYFFGEKKHWGLGTGIMYMRQTGDVTLRDFHAEYQATDNNGYTFRQILTANNVVEHIKADNINIPLVLKYKNRFSKHWGVAADAGALFNLQMKNGYSTNASFDYEAAYKFVTNADGSNTAVYDNAASPAATDFMITRAQYTKNNGDGNVQGYFNTKSAQGYNVGLGVSPGSKSGSVSYKSGSVGLLLQPSVNYFFSDRVALNVGAYYMYQTFSSTPKSGYMLTNKTGEYNSVLNAASGAQTQSYGANIGLRFFLGKRAAPLVITATDHTAPTMCGNCDGTVTLHGLTPGKSANVLYNINGSATANSYSGIVAPDGTVKLAGLCAGSYTGINATIGKKTATGTPVNLVELPLRITSVKPVNPSTQGMCNATISFYGLKAGQNATVSYMYNGKTQASFTDVVAADNSITISGLCEGSYTGISVTSNKCTAYLTNPEVVTLTAPTPPLPPVEKVNTVEFPETLPPILFDFNKSTIQVSSYPMIDALSREMKKNNKTVITIDGNTDAIGAEEYNQKLSEERAAAVKALLKQKGIKAERIKAVGHGEKEPVATNETEEGRSKNRNVEIHLIDKK